MSVQQLFGYFFKTLASLLAVINPPIAIPLFVALSANLTQQQRAKQASRVALYVAIILLAVLGFGSVILAVFGISLGAVRVAGGFGQQRRSRIATSVAVHPCPARAQAETPTLPWARENAQIERAANYLVEL